KKKSLRCRRLELKETGGCHYSTGRKVAGNQWPGSPPGETLIWSGSSDGINALDENQQFSYRPARLS
ncbi:MAG: hypothetical protein OEM85_03815, partial [Gammaproteobacteria bacterium]|nr:hypothetical protein [Gammaproteobacteria bacterium]